ncbi:SKP1-like protein 14 [Vigna unguiculata]|uniref:SKP1-like protein n=1 Tax=Vigna unguiculata TaxID=3917 RepID=A0A4D6N3M8_VIGUN|nr:SKP1-like protein 14 [Vigna unguiculata]QCE07542.1 S-phase kinase-associated protein 1 [Vigna unguiculata]
MAERGESSEAVMLKKAKEEKLRKGKMIVGDESKAEFEEGEKVKQYEEEKKVKLVTSDGVTMEVEISIVKEMETIQTFIGAIDTDNSFIFPISNVSSHILNQIIELVKGEYDEESAKKLSHDELKEMLVAANYLNMKTLFHFIATCIANIIQNKSVEFVRDFFGIINDFTEEEEAELRKTNEWAFQGVDED